MSPTRTLHLCFGHSMSPLFPVVLYLFYILCAPLLWSMRKIIHSRRTFFSCHFLQPDKFFKFWVTRFRIITCWPIRRETLLNWQLSKNVPNIGLFGKNCVFVRSWIKFCPQYHWCWQFCFRISTKIYYMSMLCFFQREKFFCKQSEKKTFRSCWKWNMF